jgi:signal transduction histidine kinase
MRAGVTDGVIWLAVTGMLLIDSWRNPVPWELVGGLVVVTVAVATTRRFPVVSLAVAMSSGAAMVFDYGGRVPVWPMLLMASMAYRAGRRMTKAKPALIVFGIATVLCLPALIANGQTVMLGVVAFAGVFPWQLGQYVRRRAHETETQGRLRERARIAADMHDSLGHELTLIAVRAGVLQVAGGLDEQHRKAVGELRESAAAATERLREIIGVLRGSPETIAGLIARSEASGMIIKATVEDVAPEFEPVAYRVVQEALTNAAKHAPGAVVVVEVARTGVSVINEPPDGPSPGLASGGHGLAGLGDRVRLAGGDFQAGPRGGGFAVTATFRGTT